MIHFSYNLLFLQITFLLKSQCIAQACKRYGINPLVTNGLSSRFHLDESTFILGESRVNFICISFFDENHVSKHTAEKHVI